MAVVQCVLLEVVIGSRMITVVWLYDDEAPTSVSKLWEPEQRRVAATWMPRQTVLLLSNAAFAPLDRLVTFVSCSTFQQMTVCKMVVGSPGPAWGSWTAPKSLPVSTLAAYLAPDQR